MNKYLLLGWAGTLAFASSSFADIPSVTDQPAWDFTGKFKNKASLICRDPNPAPNNPVEQDLPSVVSGAAWSAKAQFRPNGTFDFWEVDSKLNQQPLSKWAKYSGNWEQKGARVLLTLDAKSSATLIGTLDGGSKCGSSQPCYDKKRYRFIGKIHNGGKGPKLVLQESVIFRVNTIRAKQQFKCNATSVFSKTYRSN